MRGVGGAHSRKSAWRARACASPSIVAVLDHVIPVEEDAPFSFHSMSRKTFSQADRIGHRLRFPGFPVSPRVFAGAPSPPLPSFWVSKKKGRRETSSSASGRPLTPPRPCCWGGFIGTPLPRTDEPCWSRWSRAGRPGRVVTRIMLCTSEPARSPGFASKFLAPRHGLPPTPHYFHCNIEKEKCQRSAVWRGAAAPSMPGRGVACARLKSWY